MGHWRYRELQVVTHHHCSQCVESWGSHPGSWAPEFTLLIRALGNTIEVRQCSGVGTGAVEIHRACGRDLPTGRGSTRDERAQAPSSGTAWHVHMCRVLLESPSGAREHQEMTPEKQAGVSFRGSEDTALRKLGVSLHTKEGRPESGFEGGEGHTSLPVSFLHRHWRVSGHVSPGCSCGEKKGL